MCLCEDLCVSVQVYVCVFVLVRAVFHVPILSTVQVDC